MRSLLAIISISIGSLVLAQSSDDIQLANEYYIKGDFDKAEELFSDLSKKKNAIPLIHTNYLNLLLSKEQYSKAEVYLNKATKSYPRQFQYRVDMVNLYVKTGNSQKEKRTVDQIKSIIGNNHYQYNLIAQSFSSKELYDYSIDFFKEARKKNGRPTAYALDLATVYRLIGKKQEMIEEYLGYALSNPNNLNYIKNIFQNLFKEDEEFDFLEEILIKKIQRDPDKFTYAELLIWIELQRRNFYGAFIQARALDKRSGYPGDESMRIGQIASDNESWDEAIQIFEYVVSTYPNSYNYANARRYLIKAKEGLVKSQYPIDQEKIRDLTNEYQRLYLELGTNLITLEALRNKALLHAFYLDEKEKAIEILQSIISQGRVQSSLISKCKIDLGDIYLLQNEPWEASLLYSQVEKANKESLVGYRAKLKNAKLNYYTGDFALAKSHLDILKKATTREISNDAISLSLLIGNNTILDTSDFVMKKYADIELLVFQNKKEEAIESLEMMLKNHPFHSLTDEIYFLLAGLNLEKGQFKVSIDYLDKIIAEYNEDILEDDAAFLKAEILEKNLKQTNEAKELYQKFLTDYPGSLYVAEARKRFRKLRGDFVN